MEYENSPNLLSTYGDCSFLAILIIGWKGMPGRAESEQLEAACKLSALCPYYCWPTKYS